MMLPKKLQKKKSFVYDGVVLLTSLSGAKEELRSVCVGSSVSHGQNTRSSVL
jgi:hypothetical protein